MPGCGAALKNLSETGNIRGKTQLTKLRADDIDLSVLEMAAKEAFNISLPIYCVVKESRVLDLENPILRQLRSKNASNLKRGYPLRFRIKA